MLVLWADWVKAKIPNWLDQWKKEDLKSDGVGPRSGYLIPLKVRYAGTQQWLPTTTIGYRDWDGTLWDFQLTTDTGNFQIQKFGTLNWITNQSIVQIQQLVARNGKKVVQNAVLEPRFTELGWRYMVDGTSNWIDVTEFAFVSWTYDFENGKPTTLHLWDATVGMGTI